MVKTRQWFTPIHTWRTTCQSNPSISAIGRCRELTSGTDIQRRREAVVRPSPFCPLRLSLASESHPYLFHLATKFQFSYPPSTSVCVVLIFYRVFFFAFWFRSIQFCALLHQNYGREARPPSGSFMLRVQPSERLVPPQPQTERYIVFRLISKSTLELGRVYPLFTNYPAGISGRVECRPPFQHNSAYNSRYHLSPVTTSNRT